MTWMMLAKIPISHLFEMMGNWSFGDFFKCSITVLYVLYGLLKLEDSLFNIVPSCLYSIFWNVSCRVTNYLIAFGIHTGMLPR